MFSAISWLVACKRCKKYHRLRVWHKLTIVCWYCKHSIVCIISLSHQNAVKKQSYTAAPATPQMNQTQSAVLSLHRSMSLKQVNFCLCSLSQHCALCALSCLSTVVRCGCLFRFPHRNTYTFVIFFCPPSILTHCGRIQPYTRIPYGSISNVCPCHLLFTYLVIYLYFHGNVAL